MVGTVLRDDLQSSIEDQLQQYARGIGSAAGGAASAVQQIPQAVGDTWEDLQRAGRTGAQDVQAQLADYATQAYNASQEAQRQAQEEAQRRAEQAAQVEQELTAHANQALAGAQQAPDQGVAGAQPTAPVAPDHEPSPPLQTAGTQVANTPGAGGQVFPLSVRPDNAPTATYHSQGGSDLMAPRGTPVLNMQNGRVDEVFTDNGSHQVGGNAVLVHGDDGLDYYYAHFDQPSGVKVGQRVAAGEQIGAVGNSGNAYKDGTGATHLHIGIGHGISNGVGSEGGLGENYNAQSLLSQLQDGVGKATNTAQQAVGGAVQDVARKIPAPSQVADYIRYAAAQRGIDPETAVRVAQSEGLNTYTGDQGSSFGPFQLHMGGLAPAGSGNEGSGMGDAFKQATGLDPRDPSSWKQQVDYALSNAASGGWGPWHGAQRVGLGVREGIGAFKGDAEQFAQGAQDALQAAGSAVGGAVGGAVAGARRATGDVIQAGEQAATAARAPIYGTLAGGRDQAVQQLNVLQSQIDSLRDQLAGAPQGARQAIAGAAEPLIAGAQQTAQDIAGSRAGDLALRSGRTSQEEAGYRQRQLDEVNRLATEQRTAPPPEITPGSVLGGAARLAIENPPTAGPSLEEYRQRQTQVGQAIEQLNPLRDVPFVGGLTSQAAQFGASGQWLIPFGAVTRTGEEVLAAAGVARPLLQRVGGEALSNALQNAIYEVTTRTDATPQSVGEAFISGGALGGLMPLGAAGVTRIGQEILSRAPELTPLLRTRQRGEVDLGLITTGEPTSRPGEAPVARPGERLVEPTTRMYHGTGAEFPSPEAGRFDPNGLFGPGYYLTDRPEVAGGVVRGAEAPLTDVQQSLIERGLLTPENARNRAGAVLSSGYAQGAEGTDYVIQQDIQRLRRQLEDPALSDRRRYVAEQGIQELEGKLGTARAGPNVRAVDVPQNLRLLNVDAPVTGADVGRVGEAITRATGDPNDARSFVVNVRSQNPQGVSGETLHTALRSYLDVAQPERSAVEKLRTTNAVLADAGYDGITYSGGKRIPMTDAGGAPIEHQAAVIFPESLPKIRNAVSGRQGGQANVPFATNLGGAAFGGYAGNLATPSDASPEERARNIAAGAAAGFGGTHLITRGLGGRLAPEAAGRPTLEAQLAARPAEGFRAPGRPEGPELRATTQEPPGGPAGRAPRTLGEVHSNPHLLEEARPGETPLSDEELAAHYEQLDTRNQQVQARLDAVDEMLRNPNQKVERPPWAGGLTNLQVAEVARRADISPYEPLWWEKVGMESGSGEVREALREGGAFSAGQAQRELTRTELRAERNTLATEQRDIQAAADQLGSAPAGTRFTRRAQDAARLPFDVGSEEAAPHGPFATENQGSSGVLAEDIVTRNGTAKRPSGLSGLWSEEGQVVARGERGGRTVTGTGITDAEAAGVGEPTRITRELMPNLDAMLGDDMPDVRAQMQRVVENNQELFAAYQQGRISMASLRDDLAGKVGLSKAEWLKTPIGKAYNERELMALQAVAVDASVGANDLAHDIVAKGGVDALTPEEVAFGLANMLDAAGVLAVARGGRSTAGRTLNALKQRMNATLARGITASNERISAERLRDQAKRAAVRATQLLNKTRDLDAEARQAVAGARERGAAPNVLQQIEDAYAQLDRYQAMSLHEKGEEFTRLAKERAERAAARKAQVREAPQELLSALKAELKAEQDNFAKRKDTWETMAFWDTKANENVVTKRNAFRGGLYIEQARKAANIAAKEAETERARAFDSELRRKSVMTERASRILEAIGGEKPSRDLLRSFTEAVAADNPMVAAKFLKGLSAAPQGKFATAVEIARNSNVMRLAGMLASTATHMANATGNGVQVPLELTTHAATIGIDATRSAITGGPRQAYAAELPAMLQAYGPGFLTHLPDAVRLMQTGVSPVELADLSKLRPGFRSGLPGRAGAIVDPAIEMPLRTLQASDVLFRGGAYAMHANRVATRRATQEGYRGVQRAGRASNIVENLEDYPELYKEASDAAARMVYQERRTIPGLGGIRQATPGAELARVGVSQVLPFKTTPANIFSQGLGLSPLGAIGTLEAIGSRGGIAQRVEAGALPRERLDRQTLLAEERAARTLIGIAILGAGLWVGSQTDAAGKPKGMLTAMYDENEASTYPQGWRAWSMRLENPKDGSIDYVPLQNFGAAGVPLAMAAILTDAGRRGKTVMDGKELTRAVTGLGRYAIDNTFLQGVSDWVDALHDPGRAGGKAVEGLVASYGPYSGMGRQIQRAYGVASRNPREGLQALVDAMEANYPGVSGNVPEATTALGDARTPGQTGIGAFIAPVRYDIERDEPTLRALRENDVGIPAEPKSVNVGNGWSIDLTETERDQVKRARGAAIRDQVTQLQQTPLWQRAGLADRNRLLSQAVSNASQNTNILWLRTLDQADIQKRAKPRSVPEPYILGAAGGT